MSVAPASCTDGLTNPDDCELRAHIFNHPQDPHEGRVLSFLDSLKPRVVPLVEGRLTLPTWTPPERVISVVGDRTKKFLEKLQLPCIDEKPNLLLHRLGSEPELRQRVNDLFRPKNAKHTTFVNTSGSGKTRLLLEGLCQHWGFYFTSYVDSSLLGSNDLQYAIQSTIPDDGQFRGTLPHPTPPEKLESNQKLAGRVFKRVFLARALIFFLFIKAMRADSAALTEDDIRDYRRRWLLLQLQPSILPETSDPFQDLTQKLSHYSDIDLGEMTRKLLHRIQDALQSHTISTPSSTWIPLYCVIDEAQFAAMEHSHAFRSTSTNLNDAEPRPILHPLIQTILAVTSGLHVFILLAGTGLSQSAVDATMTSAIAKESQYRRCYDTGAFEGWKGMSRWVRQFVPKWILDNRSGNKLKANMGYWLNGRYRFVAGFVTELLLHGYNQPNLLLDAYISQFIGKQANSRDVELEPRDTINFEKLERDVDKFMKLRDILPLYVMRSIFLGPLGDDDRLWVEHGLGRLRREQGAIRVAFDEPLVVAAANHWFNKRANRSYRYFADGIGINDHKGSSNGFENFIVYSLYLIFGAERKRKLNHVFKFRGAAPSWSKKRARLVSVHFPSTGSRSKTGGEPDIDHVNHAQSFGPSATLGTYAETPEHTLQWLAHGCRTTFCFPCRNMGPDVIFVLELSNKKLLWVALQVKYSEASMLLDKRRLEHAVRSVTPDHFFRHKNGIPFSHRYREHLIRDTQNYLKSLPNGCEDAGQFSLLRVVASFPARVDFNKQENCHRNDDHPIATLRMGLVKKVTRDLSPLNILENRERGWRELNGRVSKRMREHDTTESDKGRVKRRKMMESERDSDASESSRKSLDSQKRERDTDDSEGSGGREKRRRTLNVKGKGRMAKVSLNRSL